MRPSLSLTELEQDLEDAQTDEQRRDAEEAIKFHRKRTTPPPITLGLVPACELIDG